jgi:hypothetical protein
MVRKSVFQQYPVIRGFYLLGRMRQTDTEKPVGQGFSNFVLVTPDEVKQNIKKYYIIVVF